MGIEVIELGERPRQLGLPTGYTTFTTLFKKTRYLFGYFYLLGAIDAVISEMDRLIKSVCIKTKCKERAREINERGNVECVTKAVLVR